jgi:hypothetical protein
LGCVFFNKQIFEEAMRPKVVILILVIAAGLVAGLVLLKGVIGGRSNNVPPVAAIGEPTNQEPPAVTTVQANPDVNPDVNPASSHNTAMTSEEARAAQIQWDLDEVREALANGTEDPSVTENILLDKVTNPEKEVRKAALEALMQLNDTNAIPRLQQAVKNLEDPHDKSAVLDAIAYLQLPENTTNEPPAGAIVSQPRPPRSPRPPRTQGQTDRQKRSLYRQSPGQSGQPYPGGASADGSSSENPAQPQPMAPDQANPGQPEPATPAPDNPPPQ